MPVEQDLIMDHSPYGMHHDIPTYNQNPFWICFRIQMFWLLAERAT
jgi:hypothetical protein